ncbi:Uncharacterised protein [Priestia megaterium]|uniref:hypothetical protein n=1 Tax=Priestia megaterium TaxID=1404 RepID=UPI000E1ABC16|nr:hypothetical protein [Priestia megaterium]SUV06367.1 Uncharacterised protein [Priestia megaterium]
MKEKIKELKLDENDLNDSKFNYTQLKNLGPGLVIGASVELHISSDKKSWVIEATLPIMEVGDEIYISTDPVEIIGEPYSIDKTIVIYKTQQDETLKYVLEIIKKNSSTKKHITESYYLKLPFIKVVRRINRSKFQERSWIYFKKD